jgi:2-aminoethylphosphonate-pyruvate transaminase
MNSSLTTGVILAAGLGSRLKDRTKQMPKGFIEVDGRSLIERSVAILLTAGVNRIIIGTGYLHEHFDALREKYPIQTFRNPDYSTTGSMYTLYILRHLIHAPFLLLESDLLYESAAMDHLSKDPLENIILASGATHSGDEVYVQASPENQLQQMSKDRAALTHVTGELVGITKLSVQALEAMSYFAEAQFNSGNKMLNYEDALVAIAEVHRIHVKVIEELVWCEIDDENHLRRALNLVYPKIKAKKFNTLS